MTKSKPNPKAAKSVLRSRACKAAEAPHPSKAAKPPKTANATKKPKAARAKPEQAKVWPRGAVRGGAGGRAAVSSGMAIGVPNPVRAHPLLWLGTAIVWHPQQLCRRATCGQGEGLGGGSGAGGAWLGLGLR